MLFREDIATYLGLKQEATDDTAFKAELLDKQIFCLNIKGMCVFTGILVCVL